jgi:hypothetical protein
MAGSRKPRQRQQADLRVAGSMAAKVSLLALRWRPGVGHKPTFPAHSEFPPRSAHEWQVSGDESEPQFGWTRPWDFGRWLLRHPDSHAATTIARFGACGVQQTRSRCTNRPVQFRLHSGRPPVGQKWQDWGGRLELFFSRWPSRCAAADLQACAARPARQERVSQSDGRISGVVTWRSVLETSPAPSRRRRVPWASGSGCSGTPRTLPLPAAATA